ncbi:hypothetical protein I3760_12G024900, partial [Carya illinoinensis]
LKDKNLELKKKKTDLKNIVENFTNGKRNFEKFIRSQRCVFDKADLGYMPKQKYKSYKNFFGFSYMPHAICNFYNRNGHNYHVCPIKKS